MRKLNLENCVDRHGEHPDTFEIPDEQDRNSLNPGDYAKVIVLVTGNDDCKGERVWIEIKEKRNNTYIGVIANRPMRFKGTLGDEIEFGPENICNVLRTKVN